MQPTAVMVRVGDDQQSGGASGGLCGSPASAGFGEASSLLKSCWLGKISVQIFACKHNANCSMCSGSTWIWKEKSLRRYINFEMRKSQVVASQISTPVSSLVLKTGFISVFWGGSKRLALAVSTARTLCSADLWPERVAMLREDPQPIRCCGKSCCWNPPSATSSSEECASSPSQQLVIDGNIL